MDIRIWKQNKNEYRPICNKIKWISTYDFYKDTALNGYDYIMDVTSRHIVLGAGKGKIKVTFKKIKVM